MTAIGAPAPGDIFTDSERWGDLDEWNRTALADTQISFGYGVHLSLGAQLARNELRSLFSHIVPRIASIEPAGDPATMMTTFVGGHTTLPIRYELKDSTPT